MSKINFFTNDSYIVNQTFSQAFGNKPDIGSIQKYNLQNLFTIQTNSPIFAITKSQLLYLYDKEDNQKLNVVLKPLNAFTARLPIKYFIIKGLKKSSLLDEENKIIQNSDSWQSDNVLKTIKKIQDKINEQQGTDEKANFNCLGLQFSSLNNNTLDSIFFDKTDEFHPLIVDSGCEIGKTMGGESNLAVQVILDIVGADPKIIDSRTLNSVFEIEKVNFSSITDSKERHLKKFLNRTKKEIILNYIDITSFYGLCINEGFKIKNGDSDGDFLLKFYNKNKVYIDVRDNHGYSYNHFLKYEDKLYQWTYNNSNDVVYSEIEIYSDWPIITFENMQFLSNKKEFFVSFPIDVGAPFNNIFVTSFTGKISTSKRKSKNRNKILASNKNKNEITLELVERIALKNWRYDDNKLGANYHLLKISNVNDDKNFIWNNYFSLALKSCFNNIPNQTGEFYSRIYNPINAPLIYDSKNDEVYFPTIGIAIDKFNFTFFCYKGDVLITNEKSNFNFKINTGKYKLGYDENDYSYAEENTEYNIGFLNQLFNFEVNKDFQLSKQKFLNQSNTSDQNNNSTFLEVKKLRVKEKYSEITTLKSITFSIAEYNIIRSLMNNNLSSDFIKDHPFYIYYKNITSTEYPKFFLEKIEFTMGVPKIELVSPNKYQINIVNYPENITVESSPIFFNSIDLK